MGFSKFMYCPIDLSWDFPTLIVLTILCPLSMGPYHHPSTIVHCPWSIPSSFYHCPLTMVHIIILLPLSIVHGPWSIPSSFYHCPLWLFPKTSFFFEFMKWTDQMFKICSPLQLPYDAITQKNFIRQWLFLGFPGDLYYNSYYFWDSQMNSDYFGDSQMTYLWPLL